MCLRGLWEWSLRFRWVFSYLGSFSRRYLIFFIRVVDFIMLLFGRAFVIRDLMGLLQNLLLLLSRIFREGIGGLGWWLSCRIWSFLSSLWFSSRLLWNMMNLFLLLFGEVLVRVMDLNLYQLLIIIPIFQIGLLIRLYALDLVMLFLIHLYLINGHFQDF
jgi:hypothetical protein